MNEGEWLTSTDPAAMLQLLGIPQRHISEAQKVSNRKLRLFACAFCRIWCPNVEAGMVDLWEKLGHPLAMTAANWAENCARVDVGDGSTKAALLRDIFGNPFRPPSWRLHWLREGSEQWLTGRWEVQANTPEEAERWTRILRWNDGTVMRLAQAIYEERAFDRMRILADALEEAGCTDEDILDHCRGLVRDIHPLRKGLVAAWNTKGESMDIGAPEFVWVKIDPPHVPGCWVVDLLLGKE